METLTKVLIHRPEVANQVEKKSKLEPLLIAFWTDKEIAEHKKLDVFLIKHGQKIHYS